MTSVPASPEPRLQQAHVVRGKSGQEGQASSGSRRRLRLPKMKEARAVPFWARCPRGKPPARRGRDEGVAWEGGAEGFKWLCLQSLVFLGVLAGEKATGMRVQASSDKAGESLEK